MAVLMGQRVLSEGDAVYVPAGVVHAYVSGTGVEVMTASDNVLRLGLTPKTIAVDEAPTRSIRNWRRSRCRGAHSIAIGWDPSALCPLRAIHRRLDRRWILHFCHG